MIEKLYFLAFQEMKNYVIANLLLFKIYTTLSQLNLTQILFSDAQKYFNHMSQR